MAPLYLVDGFNFLHAVLLAGRDRARWWSPENQAKVVEVVAALQVEGCPLDVWVVFDRRSPLDDTDGGLIEPVSRGAIGTPAIEVHHALDADDYIVRWCRDLAGHRQVVVVSADRSLCDRAKNHGTRSLSPWAFASYASSAPVDARSSR